ncbi:MAG TPA: S16 family serine protease [Trebonia sp.]|nr:S16 family serine protease [Trebonia sp.]
MVFKRKHLPEGVSAFLEAAQVLPAHGQLLTSGARGQGVVSRHEMIARSQFGAETWYSVHVLFRFDDGTETEISQGCARDKIGMLEVGDKVPVRFDPEDHSAVVLDMPALEARHQERVAAANAARQWADDEKIAKAQAEIEGRVWVPGDRSQQQSDLVVHRTDTRPGLAWTPVAGQLLPVEASVRAGSGTLTFDGAMATLLEQPARVALSYVAGHAAELVPGLDQDWFSRHDIRIFQPYGGMPAGDAAADVTSAGIAVVAALVSLLGGHLVRTDVALTGGVTGSGELLPVRDLSKKARAAGRMYTRQLVVPAANRQDGQSGSREQSGGLELVFAATVAEALSCALARHGLKGYVAPS